MFIQDIQKIWAYRSLIKTFAFTDLKLRYRNSVLGFFWSFLEPLFILAVLYLVFTHVIKSQIENYPLYLLFGLITWNMFVRSTNMSLTSVLSRGGIFNKVALPLEIPAISVTLTSFIMMALEIGIFFIFLVAFQFVPPMTIVWLPLLLVLLTVLALGFAIPLSVINVFYRDLAYMWGIILQAAFFLSPIIYSLDIFPASVRTWLKYNPMTGILELGHAIILGKTMPSEIEIVYTICVSFIILVIGYAMFRHFAPRVVEEL